MEIARERSLPLDDPLTISIIMVMLGAIVACLIIIYAMRKKDRKEEREPTEKESEFREELKGYPFKVTKSVPTDDAKKAKEDLRLLDLEREILGDAIRRLYEAHAEGKITEDERERLAQSYKSRMMNVKNAISKNESVVALHELESMQEDLMKLFSERFDELSSKIEELRSKTEIKPIKEITIAPEAPAPETPEEKPETEEKEKRKKKAPAKTTPKTEAEKRIEEIQAEVEKVLDKLGQMEIES
jgi:hypothetical protein